MAETVALRKESVDRNDKNFSAIVFSTSSLSARRAWIEIGFSVRQKFQRHRSLSARRAWIEMRMGASTIFPG